jgi:hypothetical protein
MSYHYRGRYTHNYQEYQRWRTQGEAQDLRSTNSALDGEADRLRAQLSSTNQELNSARNDVRAAARLQARLEERQREFQAVQGRIVENQRAYEERTAQRERELAREIQDAERRNHADVEAAEKRANQQISELRRETAEQIAQVQNEVGSLRRDLDTGLDEVRTEVQETRERLEGQISAVRHELETEKRRRVEKEDNLAAQANAVVSWIEQRMAGLTELDTLGLTMERTRTQQHLERTREILNGGHPEMSMPVAETAFASFQTAYLEAERRTGIIEGTAEHVLELIELLENVRKNENFCVIFKSEAETLGTAIEWLRAQAEQWRARRQWSLFENEREKIMSRASQVLTHALELNALVPGLLEQLRQREQRLKEAAEVVARVMGQTDSFEVDYANPNDVKSPRLLRGRIGTACVDTYLNLDGTYRIDAYGFSTAGQCGEAAERMGRHLQERWQVTEERIDLTNRQEPEMPARPEKESWSGRADELSSITQRIVNSSR